MAQKEKTGAENSAAPEDTIKSLQAENARLKKQNDALNKVNDELMERIKDADEKSAESPNVVVIKGKKYELLGGANIGGTVLTRDELAKNNKALAALLAADSGLLKPMSKGGENE